MAKAKPAASNAVFVLKVALRDNPDIWRRIAILGNQTLDDLHNAIFDAFDRFDEHLYSFYVFPPGSTGRARLRDAVEYSHSYMLEQREFLGEVPGNAAETKIRDLDLKPKRVFYYLFDFGDQWWHEITTEQIDAPREKGRYPRILERHGESPPQYPNWDEEEQDEDYDEDEDDDQEEGLDEEKD